MGLSPSLLSLSSYLHDDPAVNEPRSLSDAEVGAAELHQAVVVQNLKLWRRMGEISRRSLVWTFPLIYTCGQNGKNKSL